MAEPDSIPNLTGWWDASDNATITEAPAGRCQAITNKATTAKTYEQTVLANRPTIVTVSGMQALHFDGLAYWMADVQTNSVLQPGAGDFTVVEMVRIDPSVQVFSATWIQRDAPNVESWGLQARDALDFTARDSNGDLGQLTASDQTFEDGSTIWVIMGVSEGNNMSVYYGDVSSGALAASSSNPADRTLVGDVDSSNSAIGNLPDTQPAAGYWEGDLFKWLFYQRALTANERTVLFQNLLGISGGGHGGQRRGWRNPHRRKPPILDAMAAKRGATRKVMRGIRRHLR